MELDFYADPTDFLARAAEHLAADPVQATVVATNAERLAREHEDAPADLPRWWLVVRDGDRIVGAGMRSAPFAPYPAYVLAMPDEAAVLLGETLADRGEELGGLNGALPAARLAAEAYVARRGGTVVVAEHTRLFELGELVDPAPATGSLRVATQADAGVCLAWFAAFAADAAAQGGRPGERHAMPEVDAVDVARRIEEQRVWLWVDEHDIPVHLTGHNLPSFGVARIGPVFTPAEHRGHGYAANTVAAVSRRLLDAGSRVTLFTDQANPVSNAIYQRLGYVAVADQANHAIVAPAP